MLLFDIYSDAETGSVRLKSNCEHSVEDFVNTTLSVAKIFGVPPEGLDGGLLSAATVLANVCYREEPFEIYCSEIAALLAMYHHHKQTLGDDESMPKLDRDGIAKLLTTAYATFKFFTVASKIPYSKANRDYIVVFLGSHQLETWQEMIEAKITVFPCFFDPTRFCTVIHKGLIFAEGSPLSDLAADDRFLTTLEQIHDGHLLVMDSAFEGETEEGDGYDLNIALFNVNEAQLL